MADKPTTPATTDVSNSDIAALFAQFSGGGSPTTLQSVYSGTLSTDVNVQKTRPKPTTQTVTQPYGVNTKNLGTLNGLQGTKTYSTNIAAKPVDQTAGELFNWYVGQSRLDDNGFTKLNQRLWDAGFYNSDLKSIGADGGFNSLNDSSFGAWAELLSWTARLNAAGQDVTWEDVLNQRTGLGQQREDAAAAAKRGSNPIHVVLADPNALAETIDTQAQRILGRKANAEEQRMFVAAFHQMQSSAQVASAGEGNSTAVNPDAGAQAAAQLKTNSPIEAGGASMANTFNDFLSILGGMGSSAPTGGQ